MKTISPEKEDLQVLKDKLKEVDGKLSIITKQKLTPERMDEITTLNYEKDQIEFEIYTVGVKAGTIKPKKKIEKVTQSSIAKKVRSIKGLLKI